MLYLLTGTILATGALGIRDVIADPRSPARLQAGRPHLLTPPPNLLFGLAGETRILLVGADDRGESRGRADTIIVAYVNARARRAALLSIQRDTKANIPGHGQDKINHAYKFGGVSLLKQTAEGLLQERIHRYAKLDFEAFEAAVDILGGVTIKVKDAEGRGRGMNYDDNADGLHIHLKPGKQTLNGQQAIGYVRYRRDGDVKRTERQREFLKAVVEQHVRPGRLRVLARAASHLLKQADTDISTREALRLAWALRRIPPEGIMAANLPTRPAPAHGVYYSKIDEPKARELRAKLGGFLDGKGVTARPLKECDVLVLNGSGRAGAARAAADRIRKSGATVTATRNAERFDYTRTEIRYHTGAKQAAEELAEVLAIKKPELRPDDEFDAPGAANIMVTLGSDFKHGTDEM